MLSEWFIFAVPIIALGVNCIINIISMRFLNRVIISFLYGILSGMIVNLLFLIFFNPMPFNILDFIIVILTYLALSFCFWAFLNLNMTSLRIRLLRELLQGRNCSLNLEAIITQYSSEELIDRRIERLEKTRQIKIIDGQFILHSKKLVILNFILDKLRTLIMGKTEHGK